MANNRPKVKIESNEDRASKEGDESFDLSNSFREGGEDSARNIDSHRHIVNLDSTLGTKADEFSIDQSLVRCEDLLERDVTLSKELKILNFNSVFLRSGIPETPAHPDLATYSVLAGMAPAAEHSLTSNLTLTSIILSIC